MKTAVMTILQLYPDVYKAKEEPDSQTLLSLYVIQLGLEPRTPSLKGMCSTS